jgi:hypothetical protein
MTDLLHNSSTARDEQLYPDIVKNTSGFWAPDAPFCSVPRQAMYIP